MKKALALLMVLCLLFPAAALTEQGEETLPKLRFEAANYVASTDSATEINLNIVSPGSFSGAKTLELRNAKNRILWSREYRQGQKVKFLIQPDESMLGGHDLSVWCDGQKLSVNTAYLAVGDRHRKAVTKVDTPEQWISIVIDCANDAAQTIAILDALAQNDAKATFFLTGEFVQDYPTSCLRIRDAGHEIGSGSMSRTYMLDRTADQRFYQIRKAGELIREMIGVTPRLFMPPQGGLDFSVSAPARAEGMEVVLWSVDSRNLDKKYEDNPSAILRRVINGVEAGDIVLFHIDGYHTAQVLAEALSYYRDTLGLTVVPVGELIASAGIELPDCPYEKPLVRVTENVF